MFALAALGAGPEVSVGAVALSRTVEINAPGTELVVATCAPVEKKMGRFVLDAESCPPLRAVGPNHGMPYVSNNVAATLVLRAPLSSRSVPWNGRRLRLPSNYGGKPAAIWTDTVWLPATVQGDEVVGEGLLWPAVVASKRMDQVVVRVAVEGEELAFVFERVDRSRILVRTGETRTVSSVELAHAVEIAVLGGSGLVTKANGCQAETRDGAAIFTRLNCPDPFRTGMATFEPVGSGIVPGSLEHWPKVVGVGRQDSTLPDSSSAAFRLGGFWHPAQLIHGAIVPQTKVGTSVLDRWQAGNEATPLEVRVKHPEGELAQVLHRPIDSVSTHTVPRVPGSIYIDMAPKGTGAEARSPAGAPWVDWVHKGELNIVTERDGAVSIDGANGKTSCTIPAANGVVVLSKTGLQGCGDLTALDSFTAVFVASNNTTVTRQVRMLPASLDYGELGPGEIPAELRGHEAAVRSGSGGWLPATVSAAGEVLIAGQPFGSQQRFEMLVKLDGGEVRMSILPTAPDDTSWCVIPPSLKERSGRDELATDPLLACVDTTMGEVRIVRSPFPVPEPNRSLVVVLRRLEQQVVSVGVSGTPEIHNESLTSQPENLGEVGPRSPGRQREEAFVFAPRAAGTVFKITVTLSGSNNSTSARTFEVLPRRTSAGAIRLGVAMGWAPQAGRFRLGEIPTSDHKEVLYDRAPALIEITAAITWFPERGGRDRSQPSATKRQKFRVAPTFGLGVVGAKVGDAAEVSIEVLGSVYMGLEIEFQSLRFAPAVQLRRSNLLPDGVAIGDAIAGDLGARPGIQVGAAVMVQVGRDLLQIAYPSVAARVPQDRGSGPDPEEPN